MTLRTHQAETARMADLIASGAPIQTIYESVTPGGGKSALPGLLADRLLGRVADRVLWVVPRNSLRDQGEGDFPEWSRYRVRSAGNESDPCRGMRGYVTTYQAIVADPARHLDTVSRGRWIVALDEFHHVQDGGDWFRALDPIVQRARLRVLMSGTLARGDGKPIAWLDYDSAGRPVLEGEGLAVVRYSRADALREGAILPVHFRHLDGRAEWEDTEGMRRETGSLAGGDYAASALFTALRTEYAYELLDECVSDWRQYRTHEYPGAKLLVVAPNIEYASLYLGHLQRRRIDALMASSDDSAAAGVAIRRFKGLENPTADVLVTIAMAYEGMSVPAVTHIACLTHIRSVPWLEQCFARGNRTAPGKREAFVYGPADTRLLEAIRMIEAEQAQALNDRAQDFGESAASEGGEGSGGGRPTIRPIGSAAYRDGGIEILAPEPAADRPDGGMTPRAAEKLLRQQIARHIEIVLDGKRAGSKAAYSKIIFAKLKEVVGGKSREDCTVEELTAQWAWLKEKWPV